MKREKCFAINKRGNMSIVNEMSCYFKNIKTVSEEREIQYSTKSTLNMTDEELQECSNLFSSFYGKYSSASTRKPGEQIRMPVSYYRNNYCKPNFYVAQARVEGKLIGQAFYLRKDYTDKGYGIMTWVLQLVVNTNYRRRGIASTLLRSIWGFSDDYAWGLATTNPCTVKTLESATFRKCKPENISKHMRAIRTIGADISFVKDAEYNVTKSASQIDTNFYVDNHEFIQDDSCERQLGKLKPGHEWLAFTFCDQGIQHETYRKHFDDMVAFSEKKLKEAYSRMNMAVHNWTKGTLNEIKFIEQYGENENILDLGCGYGRHAIALAQKGANVTAVDFSERNIKEAKKKAEEGLSDTSKCVFICEDVRKYRDNKQYDKVICMYDVIGSFPEDNDNLEIVSTAYEQLKKNGFFILSVMNMELTEAIVPDKNVGKIQKEPDILRKLPPSKIMQSSGDIFEPKFLAIDTETGLVYRKEQFSEDDGLSAEYVIRDKRYKMDEIIQILQSKGFKIVEKRYVRAGHFDEALKNTDNHAKEICIVAQK